MPNEGFMSVGQSTGLPLSTGGMAVTGSPGININQPSYPTVTVTTNGFIVYYNKNDVNNALNQLTNAGSKTYNYIAIK